VRAGHHIDAFDANRPPHFAAVGQIPRVSGDKPGLLAFSRLTEAGDEVLANTNMAPVSAKVVVEPSSRTWISLRGRCGAMSADPASYEVTIPLLDFIICKSSRATPQH
jgi:hypothetical protein